MTRKDYILMAKQFNNARNTITLSNEAKIVLPYINALVKDFAEMLKNNNARFDDNKFLKACGIEN